jgi:hypothetical protein
MLGMKLMGYSGETCQAMKQAHFEEVGGKKPSIRYPH